MKFLLELVPCCGSPTAAPRKVTGPPPPQLNHESEDDDDVTSLVPPPLTKKVTKRVRMAAATDGRLRSRSLPAEWSPSLGVILEDRTVTATAKSLAMGQRKAAAAELDGSVRAGTGRRTSGDGVNSAGDDRWRVSDRDRRRRDRDDYEYGRSTLPPTMIPAFSPTPFLF